MQAKVILFYYLCNTVGFWQYCLQNLTAKERKELWLRLLGNKFFSKYSYWNIYVSRLFKQVQQHITIKMKHEAAEINDFYLPRKNPEVIKLINFEIINLDDKMEEFRDK